MANDWFKFETHDVKTVTEYVSLILKNPSYLFRGHEDIEWELVPDIDRPEFSHARNKSQLSRNDHERLAFNEFKRLALPYLKIRPANDWEFLALARHHGVPTRLLDWTENPLAALFFAVENIVSSDSCVWCYGYVEMDSPLDVDADPNPLKFDRLVLYRPPHIHPRITTQSGMFTVHPTDFRTVDDFWHLPLTQIKIPNVCRPRIRVELQRLGVHRASLFPDLEGVGKHVYQLYRNE